MQAEPSATVEIDSGQLVGQRIGDIEIFKGVPYAAPPVGALRWRPPQPVARWSGTRVATSFGPASLQSGPADVADLREIGGAPEPTSEDCLTLNLWVPRHARPAPVMVWVHGGSNQRGAGSLDYYDGTSFARDGILLVTINYRLGQFGFFAHPALTRAAAPDEPLGNYGLMDQIAALEWVKRNIASFGGDPGNVTLFGESAGGMNILHLMTIERAQGLFAKAIVQSGGGWFPPASLRQAERRGIATATASGLGGADATMEQLRALPAHDLAKQAGSFMPFVDGRLLRTAPTLALGSGASGDIPLIIGINSGEDSLLNYGGALAAADRAMRPARLKRLARVYGLDPALREELVRLSFRDGLFAAAARWVAGRPRTAPAYLYSFDYIDEARRGVLRRAPHGFELFHVFETLDRKPDGGPPATAADAAMARCLHEAWVHFAKTGTPTDTGANAWPRYSRAADPWRVFGSEGAVVIRGHRSKQLDHFERWMRPRFALFRWIETVRRQFARR